MPMKISLEKLQFDVSRMAICNKNTHPGYAERSPIHLNVQKDGVYVDGTIGLGGIRN